MSHECKPTKVRGTLTLAEMQKRITINIFLNKIKTNKMKKTITAVLAIILIVTANFNAQAQKTKLYKEVSKAVTDVNKPIVSGAALDAILQTPRQDKNLGQLTGTLKIETSNAMIFGNTEGTFSFSLKECKYVKNVTGTGANEIVDEYYSYVRGLDIKPTEYVFQKLNENEYRYTVYNVPVNTNFVISVMYNSTYKASEGNDAAEKIMNSVIYVNAYKQSLIARAMLYNPLIITNAGSMITQNVTIKNPTVQVVN